MKNSIIRLLTKILSLFSLILAFNINNLRANEGWQTHKLTLTATNVSLKHVFENIYQQTGLTVKYNSTGIALNEDKKVTINFNQTEISAVMTFLLENEKGLTFKLKNKSIIIYRDYLSERHAFLAIDNDTSNYSFPLTGKVTDPSGNPLPGVTVALKDSKKGSVTNDDGRFILPGINKGEVVVFKSLGFLSKETSIRGNNILIQLLPYISNLDETVVIAYGTTTKRMNTGNVTTVKSTDIEKQPVNNALLALQGRVPGLFITQTSGLSGSGVTVRIQGENSIESGNNPLYVIDGVPFTSTLLPSLATSNYGLLQNASPMSFINPSDIESIDVLKDADATAIYGSRAANGAILITTKKGKSGQTKVDISMQTGWGEVTRKMNLLDTKQYLKMRNEAITNDGGTVSPSDYDINGIWDTTRYTNWQKVLIGNIAHYTDIQGNISGGNNSTQYLVGANYHRETTVFPGTFSDQKASVHFNINNVSANQKFRILFSANYLVGKNQVPNTDLTIYTTLPPTAPSLYNKDGNLNWMQDSTGNSTFASNPAAYLYNKYKVKTTNLLANAVVSYEILPDLNIKSSLGYTNLQSYAVVAIPSLSTQPEYLDLFNPRSGTYGNSNTTTWIIEPQLTYNKQIGKGRIETLLGGTLQQTNNNQVQLAASGFISDAVIEDIASSTQQAVISSVANIYKYSALFSRIKYTYNDKYIINLNARRDGSSRFGEKNQFHNFGSIGFAWIFSSEDAIQKSLPFLSFGKFRGSYGIIGNDQFENYKFLELYAPVYNVSVPYQGVIGLQPRGISNPYLAWETTKKMQFGVDLGIIKDKIFFSVNYNYNRSSNQLLQYVLPAFSGFQTVGRNFPATIQNSGWEFSLSTKNINTNHFIWSTNVNITIPKNVLVAFPNLAASSYSNTLEIGKPVMSNRLFQLLGVDPETGQYQFKDSKGNPTYDPGYNDRTVLVKNYPDFYGGLQNSFQYKGIELDILLQFVKQKSFSAKFGQGAMPGNAFVNMPTTVLDRWQKKGDNAPIQRFNSDGSLFLPWVNASNSDMAWTDASYIRLKNISLSWQLPDSWKKRIHLNNCKLFVLGQNLLTITKYTGLDPETLSIYVLPPLRVLTMGVRISL
ncbi:SusC/RagA family TonB-linked outer membrane protein [Chitinophaga sp. RAB17]|uniref:SusC/RagA family TonB-linked outer membrane protein n=1 Tax=Chitinophaga sp. RAB17 TaxID=3233049 RepID=UPI003F906950